MGYVWDMCGVRYVWDMCGVRYVWDMCGVRYVWDMCGVRYANNLLKNPATKRLSGKNETFKGPCSWSRQLDWLFDTASAKVTAGATTSQFCSDMFRL